MGYLQINKRGYARLLVFILFCVGAAVGLCNAEQTSTKDPPTGVLKLEGDYLDYIELHARDGHVERITRPEGTIELPAGEYLLDEVRLRGGYVRRRTGHVDWITITQGQQEILKVGAPLVPTVKVQREGRFLRLSYEVRGAGGEAYTGGDRSAPPTFAAYKGQKKIASGKFQFG